MSSEIKVKLGALEIEFKGSEAFIKKDLLDFLTSISSLALNKSAAEKFSDPSPDPKTLQATILSTSTLAGILEVKSGSDLILAACAKLEFTDKKVSYKQSEILHEMKSATSYYNVNHRSNLSANLKALVKATKLNKTTDNSYALNANFKNELKKKLSNDFSNERNSNIQIPLNDDLSKESSNSNTVVSTLGKFLKDKSPDNQSKKFLATAIFLKLKGKTSLRTGDVSKTLRDSGQSKLNNPSDCLRTNVKQGFLEKISNTEFMVTSEGLKEFGIEE